MESLGVNMHTWCLERMPKCEFSSWHSSINNIHQAFFIFSKELWFQEEASHQILYICSQEKDKYTTALSVTGLLHFTLSAGGYSKTSQENLLLLAFSKRITWSRTTGVGTRKHSAHLQVCLFWPCPVWVDLLNTLPLLPKGTNPLKQEERKGRTLDVHKTFGKVQVF